MKICLWKHEHMIRCYIYDSDPAMLLKKKDLKRIAAWGKTDYMPINWKLFYALPMILVR